MIGLHLVISFGWMIDLHQAVNFKSMIEQDKVNFKLMIELETVNFQSMIGLGTVNDRTR